MRLVYVDEAGLSNPEHEPFLVVAGVIVNADRQLRGVMRQLDKIVERYIPPEHWADFSFHATHLFNWGGKVFTKNNPNWPLERRLEIADELAAIPKKYDLRIAFGSVERAKFPQSFDGGNIKMAERTKGAHVTAYMVCALNVDHWLRQKTDDEIAMMIVEDNDQARQIIRETQSYNQRADLISELSERERMYLPLKRIVEDPLFQPKRKSSVLQLADFCAYVIKRRLMGDARHDRFFGPLSERLAQIEPPSEKRARNSRQTRPSQVRELSQ
jgi:hypothetical protein